MKEIPKIKLKYYLFSLHFLKCQYPYFKIIKSSSPFQNDNLDTQKVISMPQSISFSSNKDVFEWSTVHHYHL